MNVEQQLKALAVRYQTVHIHDLFKNNPKRFEQLHRKQDGIVFDFSKQRLDQDVLDQLIALAKEKKLDQWIKTLFSQSEVNHTEHRSAMHWALRMPPITNLDDPNYAVNHLVHSQLEKMSAIVEKIQKGQFRGVTGEKITNIVNIGVGGSDLGPLMVCHALAPYQLDLNVKVHFASTMDGSQLSQIAENLNPASTLFIISSKSFTTIDTLLNAQTARKWLTDALGDHQSVIDCHFIGVSTNITKMNEWGISPDLQLNLWEWVGGRYSLWSAIGLPIAISIGMDRFKNFLAGAYAIDQHFQHTDWLDNLPVLLGLIGVWNNNYLDIHTHAILPYDGRLEYFTSYLQQLEMESNGKSVKRDDLPVSGQTCPIIWGEVGPNAQHAFYQLLHQGTATVSSDFIIAQSRYRGVVEPKVGKPFEAFQQQHRLSVANCLAQSRLLAFGSYAVEGSETLPIYRQYQGNKPSTTMIIPKLDPFYLGALIAMYEHKVFVQSVIWDINPFDQWGVEMGKTIAKELLPVLEGQTLEQQFDVSTQGLLNEFLN
ncbi:glucose-6-phosphate isomerase [Acinetobacter qingfengensis]|uniref:Glucose-6-phosphate isomerase n=1 Tax=Acinetobacter qingfengensis TaxID=1262585 RepID=A0A1E7RFA5_9GAMM|nr:glucose-6-phosphate isomerase [Acinetobacter qingfengensis]KAA8731839.1 glucose-6-phosphate isomerase [Acinetobacter qingfengensis]OEY98038.1 glucose-6-phosphate isomerase [Acinetobacter qingfengensis]